MIIVEIGRGLGNSMFVYAAAKALANHHNTKLKLDTSYLRSWPRWEKYGGSWEFELGKFNISAKEAPKKEIRKYVFKTGFRPIDKLIRKYKLFERKVYHFPTSGSSEIFFKFPDNIFLWGYFGNEKFFKPIKKIIREEFTLKNEYKEKIKSFLKKISKGNSVSIHVRRGEIDERKNNYVLDKEYYKKAIELIKKRVKNPKFYVFSDKIEWCKKNLVDMGTELNFIKNVKGGPYTLELMKNCKHNILANSALSWWTGYLNPNSKKIVIAPEHFSHFRDAKIDKDFLPKDWIKIRKL